MYTSCTLKKIIVFTNTELLTAASQEARFSSISQLLRDREDLVAPGRASGKTFPKIKLRELQRLQRFLLSFLYMFCNYLITICVLVNS